MTSWIPLDQVRAGAMPAVLDPSLWEFQAASSFCRPLSGYRYVEGAEVYSPFASVRGLQRRKTLERLAP